MRCWIEDESAPRFVALLPEVCKTAEEWAAKCGGTISGEECPK